MYESPINLIHGQIQIELEGTITKAIQDVMVDADREELVKALQYDRGQYEKGYADALKTIVRCKDCKYPYTVKYGRWIDANDGTHFCSYCGEDAPYGWEEIDRNFINSADDVPDRPSNFCPNCGCRMDGERKVEDD